ncbi:MAG: outer membrane protein assembly factor BamD [Rubrivivax sp.]|nr:outer membrane protein assembly factor BamD [Rubrivivax sp.]
MRRAWKPLVALAIAGLLAGCGTTDRDELAGKTADRLYRDAQEEASAGSYERAARALERVEGLAAGTLLAQQAQIDRAYYLWKANDRAGALAAIERFIRFNPSSPVLDYAMYLRGLINFNDSLGLAGWLAGQELAERDQQAARDSFEAFRELTERFPDSRYTPDALTRMAYITNSLAAHELHVARYYFRRGAYVAAANRARHAISEYQTSPSTEEALYLLMQCYERLELPDLRADVERVLRLNFPQSRFIAQGSAVPQRPWWQLW